MTQGPEDPHVPPPYGEPTPPSGETPPPPPPPAEQPAPTPPPYGQAPPPQPGYAPPQPGYPQPQPGYAQPGYPAAAYGASAQAPYGVDPKTGMPFSDKSKLVAGLLQIFLGGFGVGRFYLGDNKTAVWQIVVTVLTCGIGSIWGLIDGIMILATDSKDINGLPLRNS
ncbi:TM2 domain-containing protein [Nocardioides conyzicola]|uniref:TM2 domain-containing protein n=1 Tax=Nocardioides conyzicola TaxID=1651781 RepID=A0ABP8WSI0_9ACTN